MKLIMKLLKEIFLASSFGILIEHTDKEVTDQVNNLKK